MTQVVVGFADMEYLFPAGLVAAGIVNSIPVTGAFSAAQLERLYGMPFKAADPNTLLLMQHRAVLFGIVGGLCFTVRFRLSAAGQARRASALCRMARTCLFQFWVGRSCSS